MYSVIVYCIVSQAGCWYYEWLGHIPGAVGTTLSPVLPCHCVWGKYLKGASPELPHDHGCIHMHNTRTHTITYIHTHTNTHTHTHNMDPHLLVFSNYSYTHFPPIPDVAGIHPIVVVVYCRNSRWSHKGCFSPAPSKERQHGRRGSKGQQSGMTERQNVVSLLHILDSAVCMVD